MPWAVGFITFINKNMTEDKSEESLIRRKRENYRNQRQVIELLKKFVNKRKPNLSLEVGCGDGYFSEMVSNLSKKIAAVDVNKRIADSVLREKNVTFKIADGRKLPFKGNTFDLVFSVDVVEHIDEDQQFINESLRVLKKNGLLILVTPNKQRFSNRILSLLGINRRYPLILGHDFMGEEVIHIREYAKNSLLKLINESRFKTKNVEIRGCFLGFSGNFGFVNCPKIFTNYCGSLFLTAERAA